MGVIDWASKKNLMTAEHLVAAFQPSLLSRSPQDMSAEDHVCAAATLVFLVKAEGDIVYQMQKTVSSADDLKVPDDTQMHIMRMVR